MSNRKIIQIFRCIGRVVSGDNCLPLYLRAQLVPSIAKSDGFSVLAIGSGNEAPAV